MSAPVPTATRIVRPHALAKSRRLSRNGMIRQSFGALPGSTSVYRFRPHSTTPGTAAETFRELLVSSPQYVPTYLMLAQTLVRLGRESEAQEVLRVGVGVAGHERDVHAQGELQAMLDSLE